MKPHVLFVTEKWTDVNPSKSLTNNYHNLFGSLDASGLATYTCIHYDEYFHTHNNKIDNHLIKIVEIEKPDVTVVCPLPWYPHCPSPQTYSAISKMTRIVFVWADAVHFMHYAETLERYASLVVTWDMDRNWHPGSKFIHLWTPQDPRIYNDPGLVRDIDVLFVGNSSYSERQRYLNHLATRGFNLVVRGGRNGHPIGVHEYVNLIQRAKISLNFSLTSENVPQLKGRPFESMLCGAMLMESRNHVNWIERWYMPGIHFVSFDSEGALENLVRHYLEHEEERLKIAQNGWRRTNEWYNNIAWWETIFRTLNIAWDSGNS